MWDMITKDGYNPPPRTIGPNPQSPYWARPELYTDHDGRPKLLTLGQFINQYKEHGRIFHPVGGGLEEVRNSRRLGVRVVFYPMGRDDDGYARWAVQFPDTGRVAAIFVEGRSPADRSEDKKGERHE